MSRLVALLLPLAMTACLSEIYLHKQVYEQERIQRDAKLAAHDANLRIMLARQCTPDLRHMLRGLQQVCSAPEAGASGTGKQVTVATCDPRRVTDAIQSFLDRHTGKSPLFQELQKLDHVAIYLPKTPGDFPFASSNRLDKLLGEPRYESTQFLFITSLEGGLMPAFDRIKGVREEVHKRLGEMADEHLKMFPLPYHYFKGTKSRSTLTINDLKEEDRPNVEAGEPKDLHNSVWLYRVDCLPELFAPSQVAASPHPASLPTVAAGSEREVVQR